MSKSKIHNATWKVFGRGKGNQTFTACLPAQAASKGDRVKLESKAGVITTGTLTELHKAEDGLEYWKLERDPKSAEEHAADRALRYESQAEYWQSDRGAETARKIRERAARKAAANGQTVESKPAEEPKSATVESKPAESATVESMTDDAASKLAALLAAGLDVDTAVAALKLAGMATVESKPASKPASKPRQSTRETVGDCGACKRTSVTLTDHPAGVAVCNYCKSADVETIQRRAARKAGK